VAGAGILEERTNLLLPVLFGMVALMAGLMVANTPLYLPFVIIAALVVAGIAFLKTEWAIHLLILSMLLSPEFSAGGGMGAAGSVEGSKGAVLRMEDLLLVIIGVAWLAKMAVHKQLSPLLRNPMNGPIALYVLISFLATLVGIMTGRVHAMLGMAYVFKYIEYFVIFFLALHHVTAWCSAPWHWKHHEGNNGFFSAPWSGSWRFPCSLRFHALPGWPPLPQPCSCCW